MYYNSLTVASFRLNIIFSTHLTFFYTLCKIVFPCIHGLGYSSEEQEVACQSLRLRSGRTRLAKMGASWAGEQGCCCHTHQETTGSPQALCSLASHPFRCCLSCGVANPRVRYLYRATSHPYPGYHGPQVSRPPRASGSYSQIERPDCIWPDRS